jgi:D-alanyl-D-alanine carboxypeptidase
MYQEQITFDLFHVVRNRATGWILIFLSFIRKNMKSLALVPAFTAASVCAALAQSPVLVVDASSGQVLLQEDATRPWNPASTTKMMTVFVALRAVKAGQLTMDTPLIASANAARQKPSKIGIRPGQEITLDNAIKVLMVKSANDLAIVVAEAVGGSVGGFSQMMNAEARRLGMRESRFSNPHGFHEQGHQTSARDLALLARAMLSEFPEYTDYWGIGAVQLGNKVMNNTNGLIGRYSGATGFKTGFVCASGFNLVAMASRGGRTLITVVLGASSGGDRVVRSAQLLDQGFGTWSGTGQTLQSLPASGYSTAPDMRGEICSGKRRGVVLADDSDYGGAILADSASGDSMAGGSPMAFFSSQSSQPQRSYATRPSGGRGILGPRTGISPIAVYLGRTPGSTAVAVGPGGRRAAVAASAPSQNSGIPASAAALAPTGLRTTIPGISNSPALERPAAQSAIRPAAARPKAQDDEPASGAPLQLPGVITSGPKAGAAAGIRPRQTASAPTAPQRATASAPKAQTSEKAKVTAAKAVPAKAVAAKATVPKKKKPVEDDE